MMFVWVQFWFPLPPIWKEPMGDAPDGRMPLSEAKNIPQASSTLLDTTNQPSPHALQYSSGSSIKPSESRTASQSSVSMGTPSASLTSYQGRFHLPSTKTT